ncbi:MULTISPECIES: hypothetical protein [unclassified Streptomyces]|uniref:hypothetical protein n=1 Tax=unclassified Streptomyces TaxID=2593676 RepID=UPI002E287236|nr:hypothetical protein [Streptomyces sp. NBC_00285]
MTRHISGYIYPPAVTKKLLGVGLSIFTAAAALQKALGSTPFSVVDSHVDSTAYCIALAYTTLGIVLGLASMVYSLKTSSLGLMGYLGAYLLAFASISLINSPATPWMQFANVAAFLGISIAALSAWLRHLRERP